MIPVILAEGATLSSALSDFGSVMTEVTSTITGNTTLYAMFAGGLMVVGAKVFKRIKNAVK